MKTIKYTITFHSYWHCGCGLGAGAKADALVVKNDDSMPFVPGRTVKGLVRENAEMLVEVGNAPVSQDDIEDCFGTEGNAEGTSKISKAFFSNATLSDEVCAGIQQSGKDATDYLYRQMASTSIDDSGVAADHTLRSVEVTVPCELNGYVGGVPDNMADFVCRALRMVRRLGVGRNRGLGRCTITAEAVDAEQSAASQSISENIGSTVMFRCHLKTDIILNQKSASEGANKSLDFIPGACFLGIAASRLYSELAPADSYSLFHSGAVRYSDAQPVANIDGIDYRAIRIPASMFYEKGKSVADACYIHHHYNRNDDRNPPQLKQCRAGFYAFPEGGKATEVKSNTSYAIKSAYDTEKRRSEDAKMFGYESLCPGTDLCFSVDFDDCVSQELRRKVVESLVGLRRVGRSRSAQYGQVEIEVKPFEQTKSSCNGTMIRESGEKGMAKDAKEIKKAQVLYAESRLIFFNAEGQPTFQPTADQLGLPAGSVIRWDMSQVRTFQYSPWNYKRQCYDADRCGIEKGSVIVVETDANISDAPSVVGNFRAEGFGHVIFNPAFLNVKPGANGIAAISFAASATAPANPVTNGSAATVSPLVTFVKKEIEKEVSNKDVYTKVNEFVKDNGGKFQGKDFASQWGAIRNIAQTAQTADELYNAIFSKAEDSKGHMRGFLMHGVAAEKWDDNGRRDILKKFITSFTQREQDEKAIQATINLASEMAKICRNNGKEANND